TLAVGGARPTGGAPDRDGEQQGHRGGHHPPGGARLGDQSGRAQGHHHPNCRDPVVADDEVPEEPAQRAQPVHVCATASAAAPRVLRDPRRAATTSARENVSTHGTITSRATSSPGQLAPAPSAPQKVPKLVSITPTPNLRVFSGTRPSGPWTISPAAA